MDILPKNLGVYALYSLTKTGTDPFRLASYSLLLPKIVYLHMLISYTSSQLSEAPYCPTSCILLLDLLWQVLQAGEVAHILALVEYESLMYSY